VRRREFLQLSTAGIAASLFRPAAGRADDRQRLRLRGFTIDAARLTEKPDYYRRVIDFCHDWKLNALLFRLADDQGSAFQFESHPELVTHEHALTSSQARDLAEYGRRRDVTIIPEIESFGHTLYITSVSKFAHLADTPPDGQSRFVGICPVHPDSLALMRDLYAEVAHAFSSPYLHGGCDEVNWGGSAMSRRALESKTSAEIGGEYLNRLDSLCGELGKELIVWGDYVAHKEPDILAHLNKRIIVMDWQYYVTDPQPLAATAQQVIARGMRVIGAPALISCEWGPRAGALTLSNMDAFADAYAAIPDDHCLGVIVTNWIPSRYLQNSLWDSIGYAAVALNEGSARAQEDALRRFVTRHYGDRWHQGWHRAVSDLYRLTPGRAHCAPQWQLPRLPLPSASDAELQQSLATPALDPSPYVSLASTFRQLRTAVRRNHADFSSFLLSVEYLAYVAARESQWREAHIVGDVHGAVAIVKHIADGDRTMLAKLDSEWNVGRFPDSRGKSEKLVGTTSYDQLVFHVRNAYRYAAELARDPAEIQRLLHASHSIPTMPRSASAPRHIHACT